MGLFFMRLKIADSSPANHLLISQIQISGDKASYDFIELFNPANKEINLKNYRLVKRTQNGASDSSIKSWRNDGDIFMPPGSYFLWASGEYGNYASSYLVIDAMTSAGISINNGIALKTNDTDETVDAVAWGETKNAFIEGAPFAVNPEPNQSLERKNKDVFLNALDTDNNAEDFILVSSRPRNSRSEYAMIESEQNFVSDPLPQVTATVTPTPVAAPIVTPKLTLSPVKPTPSVTLEPVVFSSPTPVLTTYPQAMRINEFLPNPIGSDNEGEWVELFNDSGESLNLADWQIDDEIAQGSKPFKIGKEIINPFGYAVFSYKQTKISLNNDKGEVNLITPNGKIMQKVYYEKAPEGESYNYFSNGWRWCKKTTPAAQNDICGIAGKAVDNSNKAKITEETVKIKTLENKVTANNISEIKKNEAEFLKEPIAASAAAAKKANQTINGKKTKAEEKEKNSLAADYAKKETKEPPFLSGADLAEKNQGAAAVLAPLSANNGKRIKASPVPYALLVIGIGLVFALMSIKAKDFVLKKEKNTLLLTNKK